MRFLVDQNISPLLADELRLAGHDVVHTRDSGLGEVDGRDASSDLVDGQRRCRYGREDQSARDDSEQEAQDREKNGAGLDRARWAQIDLDRAGSCSFAIGPRATVGCSIFAA